VPAVAKKTKASSRGSSSAEQLLEATSQLLVERNAVDVSFSAIAETSGLNSALIKYHFGSKEGMLLALVKRDAKTALERLDRLVHLEIPSERKIRLHVAGIINTYFKYPYLNRLIHNLLSDSEDSKQLAKFFVKPLVDAQSKILEEGVRLGHFRRVDPMFFYFSVVGACDHLFFGSSTRKYVYGVNSISNSMKENYIEFVSDLALRMLSKT
jgi:TetR/AcrR family transcriptional regulator